MRKILVFLGFIAITLFLINGFWRVPDEESVEPVNGEFSVHFIDVGQGDCVLVSSGGHHMLVDCGDADHSKAVINYLSGQGVKKLDKIIATHPHSDHMGGMYKIIDKFGADEIIMPHIEDSMIPATVFFEKFLDACEDEDCRITEAAVGDVIKLGDAQARVVSPCGSYDSLNNLSVGIILTYGETSFFLAADAESVSEADMLKTGLLHHVNVYKAGHHGSNSSSSSELLEVLSPDYAVISCGSGNDYGHPHKAAVSRIKKHTDKIYRTDLCGTIVFVSDGESISVETERS